VTPSIRIDNARVWTGFQLPGGLWQTSDAVLMRGGRIVALGDEARALDADEVVDAGGGFIAPAFGDGHVHPIFGGLEQQFAPVREAVTAEGIAAAVALLAGRLRDSVDSSAPGESQYPSGIREHLV